MVTTKTNLFIIKLLIHWHLAFDPIVVLANPMIFYFIIQFLRKQYFVVVESVINFTMTK